MFGCVRVKLILPAELTVLEAIICSLLF